MYFGSWLLYLKYSPKTGATINKIEILLTSVLIFDDRTIVSFYAIFFRNRILVL